MELQVFQDMGLLTFPSRSACPQSPEHLQIWASFPKLYHLLYRILHRGMAHKYQEYGLQYEEILLLKLRWLSNLYKHPSAVRIQSHLHPCRTDQRNLPKVPDCKYKDHHRLQMDVLLYVLLPTTESVIIPVPVKCLYNTFHTGL